MRDTVTDITLPTVRPSVEVVRNQFEIWRKRRPCRGRIPEALWQAAVGYVGSTLFARCPKDCDSITMV